MKIDRLTAIIPAAGEATRLHPHTSIIQKPMLPMGEMNRKLIDFSLGIAECAAQAFITIHHDNSKTIDLEDHLRRHSVRILRDKKLMGAASLIAAADEIFGADPDGQSIVLPADHVVEGIDLLSFYETHLNNMSDLTILSLQRKDYGQFLTVDDGGRVLSISDDHFAGVYSSSGIYIVNNRTMLNWSRRQTADGWNGEPRSFLRDIVVPLIANRAVSIYTMPSDGYWDDAGTLERYLTNNMRLSGGDNIIDSRAHIEEGVEIETSVIIGNVWIDGNKKISNSIISGNSSVIYNTRIGG